MTKREHLLELMTEYTRQDIAVAFSGGVDSSLILKIACDAAAKWGTTVYAVTIHTRLHPVGDIEIAQKVAQEMGAVHMVLHVDELNEADIMDNPVDRCYRCKKTLFTKALSKAAELGVKIVVEGTNEDDLHVYRPGIKALSELGVKSPLALCHMTKQEIRELAAEYGISVANRPANPCLATRFPYQTRLSYEVMEQVDEAETMIRKLGFYNVRIRVHEQIARIEIDQKDFQEFLKKSQSIVTILKEKGFLYVTLDLEGFRSGSMDIPILTER
ncbi:MAG: ATP-dependent sacrificial sulfur transferase LarE [Lachnospiraceae bacterium]